MLVVDQVKELTGEIKDPIIDVPLKEIEGIVEVSIKGEKEHASAKVVMAQLGGTPQLDLQMAVVNVLKKNDAETVGIRFGTLPEEKVNQFKPREGNKPKTIEGLLSQNNPTELIVIASGKGGVGKSTVAVNLVVVLAREGKKVGLVGADIYGFSVLDTMGIDEESRINGKEVIPVERHGVKAISMAFFMEENTPIIWRGPILGKMLMNFFTEVRRGDIEYSILDLPPGTGDVALDVHTVLPSSKEIIVTTSYPTAASVAARVGVMAKHTDYSTLGVIEDMNCFESRETENREYILGKGGGTRLADEPNIQLFGELSLEQSSWSPKDFAPSTYQSDNRLGKIYSSTAQKIIAAINEQV